jgi:ABC-type oligopeptide transport system substrate-binding subunit
MRLVRNTNYWRTDRPYLDEVPSLSRDAQTAGVELKSGAIDMFGYKLPIAAGVRFAE